MRYSYIPICILALIALFFHGVGAACNAQVTFDACIERGKQYTALCSDNDWPCKCQRQKDILNCYNLCPEDKAVQAQGEIQKTVVNADCIRITTSTNGPTATLNPTASLTSTHQPTQSGVNDPSRPNDAQQIPIITGYSVLFIVGLNYLL
ncbi:hypothetical protein K7432_017661 [Basidiobolus ranarum]|uniref:Uncharacterized protein n=1 Tax=Basidiobolus ranarum TaxID=34480 RepID=A0ABR2VK15_9FUNG